MNEKINHPYAKLFEMVMGIIPFKLKKEEVNDIVEQLPFHNKNNMNMVQETVMSVIDQAMYDGILIGEERGLEKGLKKGELKSKIETILIFLKNFPDLKNLEIAILCKSKEAFVANVRAAFEQDKEKVMKTFARDTFKSIPNMTEKDFLDIEKTMLEFWKEFKMEAKKS